MDKLMELRGVICGEPDILEMYQGFIKANNGLRTCKYAQKCEILFIQQIYPKLIDMIKEINVMIEGMSNGERFNKDI